MSACTASWSATGAGFHVRPVHVCQVHACCLGVQRHIASDARQRLDIGRQRCFLQHMPFQHSAAEFMHHAPDLSRSITCQVMWRSSNALDAGQQGAGAAWAAGSSGAICMPTCSRGTPEAWNACTCHRQGSTSPCTKCAMAAPDLQGRRFACIMSQLVWCAWLYKGHIACMHACRGQTAEEPRQTNGSRRRGGVSWCTRRQALTHLTARSQYTWRTYEGGCGC
jgi:hypothetical protein